MKINKNPVQYYVEGETEKVFIEQIKNKYVLSGKIDVLNILQNEIKNSRLMNIKPDTTIVLIFDTDVEEEGLLKKLENNIKILRCSKRVKEIIIIPQVLNFEDELVYATNIKSIEKFIPKCTKKEFKGKFIKLGSGMVAMLEKQDFNADKLWSRSVNNGNIFYIINKDKIMSAKIKI